MAIQFRFHTILYVTFSVALSIPWHCRFRGIVDSVALSIPWHALPAHRAGLAATICLLWVSVVVLATSSGVKNLAQQLAVIFSGLLMFVGAFAGASFFLARILLAFGT